MDIFLTTFQNKLIHGDCLEELKKLETRSIDALVTDPPAGISFMNKGWDDHKGGRNAWVKWFSEIMAECLRVMKPGAHGLVWAIPRTSHWTGWALERAGFEVRDVITHLFGSGFPKSLDISKSIDKAAGANREVLCPSKYSKRRVSPNGGRTTGRFDHNGENVTAPSTPEAKQWDGYGTALKPACEFWFLVRKPIDQDTVALNVLKWGTGGLNIDGCRIGTEDNLNGDTYSGSGSGSQVPGNNLSKEQFKQPKGRFPANLIFDEQAAEMLDEQSGSCKTGGPGITKENHSGCTMAGPASNHTRKTIGYENEIKSGASRFFYCAKPSKQERNAGLSGKTQTVNDGRETEIDNPFQRGETGRLNTHPTVKPIRLMRYLIRMITPPGGIVLDPFMGSGTTGCAAKVEVFRFLGIEKNQEYLKIAESRIHRYKE